MSNLSPLQLQAVKLLGQHHNPSEVRTLLELPQTLFASWREDAEFEAAIQSEREVRETDDEKAVLDAARLMFGYDEEEL